MESNMQVFHGRSVDADSTVMPQLFSWVDATIDESPGCNSPDDHCVVLFFNLPAVGVGVANMLNRYRKNSLAIIVHANRAAQKTRTVVNSWDVGSTCFKID